MAFTVQSLNDMEKEINSASQRVLKATKTTAVTEINHSNLLKLNKDVLANCLESFVKLFAENIELCKTAAAEVDKLKSEQIENQKEIMKLQKTKMGSVQETVKSEMKSFASIVQKSCSQSKTVPVNIVKQAVRSATAEDCRAKNFIMYGLPEDGPGNKEDLISTMEMVFEELEYETPYPEIEDAYRLGEKNAAINRPVKVTLKSSDLVQYLLRRANKLKRDNGKFRSVYLAPDRNKDERLAHNKLVVEMKELMTRHPTKYYFIRDKRVLSVDKRLATG